MTVHQSRYVGGDKSDIKKCRDYAEKCSWDRFGSKSIYIGYSKSADRVKDAIHA